MDNSNAEVTLLQPPKWGRFYIWQTHMYGTSKVDGEAVAEIWRFRSMPCTPAGDFIGEVENGADAIKIVEQLNSSGCDLDHAKDYLKRLG
jgi:hypothetical protein